MLPSAVWLPPEVERVANLGGYAVSSFRQTAWQKTARTCQPRTWQPRNRATQRKNSRHRPGNVLVFTLMLMVTLCAGLAFAVDLGYLCMARTELQRSADAAALAGAAAMYRPEGELESEWYHLSPEPSLARIEARRFVRVNPAVGRPIDVDLNHANVSGGDIVVGHLNYPPDHSESLDAAFDPPNTVHVTIPLSDEHENGSIGLFFARVIGINNADSKASATATVWYPSLLPFTTSRDNWSTLAQGGAGDQFAYQPGQGSLGIASGSDGIPEVVMFPGPWDGEGLPPGNFGVLDIGGSGATLETVRRQVDAGPSVDDMQSHADGLAAGSQVPGLTGIKSSSKHAFLGGSADGRQFGGILGRPRQLPLYESVTGNGANAVFTLSRFVAVRVMALQIDGQWRTEFEDTDGEDITGVMVQPLQSSSDLIQVQLTR